MRHKSRIVALQIVALSGFLLSHCAPVKEHPHRASTLESHESLARPVPVSRVDLDRYVGTWYEIASYPQWFQRGCHCTRARYSKNEDGTISVLNSCNRDSTDGKYSTANGTAVVQNDATNSNARLKVFFFLPWLRLFGGDYWIIGLDDEYRWAVVSEPSQKYLWILSRTPEMPGDQLDRARKVIRDNGLDLEMLNWTEQKGCAYPD